MSERVYGIFIFGIIFNLLFAMFGFAFTTFANEPTEFIDTILDEDSLWEEGIVFINATNYEINYDDDWTYFQENNKKFRMRWFDPLVPLLRPAGLHHQQQSIVEQYSDTWLFPEYLNVRIGEQDSFSQLGISNSSMVEYWEHNHNWTRFSFSNGLLGFITTIDNNITKAVYETGALNITIGEPETETAYDVNNFVDWYWESLFKFNASGIPPSISAFVKIITILNLVSAIVVIRDLFKL